jgi:hypothetical protein
VPESHRGEARGRFLGSAFAAYLTILANPRAVGLILCMDLSFTGMFAYITGSPFVFIEHFGFSSQQYALLFGANIAGVIVATLLTVRLVGRLGPAPCCAGAQPSRPWLDSGWSFPPLNRASVGRASPSAYCCSSASPGCSVPTPSPA